MSHTLQQLMSLVQRAQRPAALALADDLHARGERHPLVLMLAAESLEEKRRFGQAAALLEEALRTADGEPELWRRYGVVLGKQGLLPEARTALAEAFDIAPDQPAIRMALATAHYRLGELDSAAAHFEALVRDKPDWAEPLGALAAIAAQRGDGPLAADFARRALDLAPDHLPARIAQARAALVGGDASGAERLADGLLGRLDRTDDHRIALLGLRGDARDALGRHDAAFTDYMARNALLAAQHGSAMAASGVERRLDQSRRLAEWAGQLDPEAWAASRAPAEALERPCAGHLFIAGFPRSGTTLLEKALAGHDAILTLPEIDCLGATAGHLLADRAALDRLTHLPATEIAALRDRYFTAVSGVAGSLQGKVIVDKLPLHAIALPLIARLFPDARIILSLRDPRDVVLSGFRRRFQMNAAMFELLTLRGAADYYDAVMTLVERYRACLRIDPHQLRHEDMVDDFEGEVRKVLALVGLGWSEPIRDFAGRAAANARTPSDYQLKRGLNRDGVGSWRAYAAQLKPVLPVLQRWIDRWGYAPQ